MTLEERRAFQRTLPNPQFFNPETGEFDTTAEADYLLDRYLAERTARAAKRRPWWRVVLGIFRA